MNQEAPDKFVGRQCHDAVAVSTSIVLPSKADLAIVRRHEPVVRDGDAMGINSLEKDGSFESAQHIKPDGELDVTRWIELESGCQNILNRLG